MRNDTQRPTSADRRAWNAGKKVGTKRLLKPRQIWAIRSFLDRERRTRDRGLFDLAIDSKFRGCDLVKIKIGTLVIGPKTRTRAMVVQQKTGRRIAFELMSGAHASLLAWLEQRGGTVDAFAFPSSINRSGHRARGSMPAWSMYGSRRFDCAVRNMAYTRFGQQRFQSFIKTTGNLQAVQMWFCT